MRIGGFHVIVMESKSKLLHKIVGIVEDDISAVYLSPFSLLSSPISSEDDESFLSSTSCLVPSSPIGGS